VTPTDRVTVCICTRNRPEELARCLQSVRASVRMVNETVVSDDSTDERTRDMILGHYPWVRYVEGPRRGLGANRNCALSASNGDYLLFLDDDACLGPAFLDRCSDALAASEQRASIVSGRENNRGVVVQAHDQSFLGFQHVPYRRGDRLRTIVINATLFPRQLFSTTRFDDQLVYGYDEVDIALKAVSCGYTIVQCDEAINEHYPSEINRDFYRPHTEASRIYVTLQRYMIHERRPLKAALYLVCASAHCVAAALKRRGPRGLRDAWHSITVALSYRSKAARSTQ
jgi:GT2 family glycosyltransferase